MKYGIFGLVCVMGLMAQADVKADIRKVTGTVKSYNGNTYRSDVKAKAVAGLAAYETFASETNCPNELGDLAAAAINAAHAANDLELAKDFAAKIAAEGTSQPARLAAARYLAIRHVNAGDYAAAEARYDAFLATPKLVPVFYAAGWNEKAQLKVLRQDRAGALATLERGFAAIPASAGWRKDAERFFQDYMAEVHVTFYDPQAAYDLYVKAGRRGDALRLYDKGLLGDAAQAAALCKAMLTDEKAPFGERLAGWTWLYNREPEFADAHPPLRPGDTLRNTNSVIGALAFKLTRGQIYHLEGSTSPIAYFGDRAQVIRTWTAYLALLKTTGAQPEFGPAEAAVVSFAGVGDKAGAVAAAKAGLANEKLKPEERYELALMAETLTRTGSADEIAAALGKVEPQVAGELDAKLRLKHFDRVGSAAMMTLDESLARGFAQYRAKVGPEPAKKSYVVKFSDRPVAGAADWTNLPFKPEESAFDRKYGGGGAAFLVTDVSTGDRGEAVKGGEGRTTLSVVADVWGVHILRTFHDQRARDFERGFLDAGSFEEYIAPGENQPYTCMLVYPKKDAQAGGFETAYDGEGRRRIDFRDPASFKSDVVFTDDAIKVYTGISWNNFATLVPKDGAAWDFESVFWGPNECAWNGLKTIHGRSSWGRLVFEMPEKARLKILEDQICKAVVRFKAEKKAGHGHEGLITHWTDEAVGDPVFYAERVKPLVDQFDAVAERVNADMTAADVKDIAENWLQQLVDFPYIVNRLRGEWLRERL